MSDAAYAIHGCQIEQQVNAYGTQNGNHKHRNSRNSRSLLGAHKPGEGGHRRDHRHCHRQYRQNAHTQDPLERYDVELEASVKGVPYGAGFCRQAVHAAPPCDACADFTLVLRARGDSSPESQNTAISDPDAQLSKNAAFRFPPPRRRLPHRPGLPWRLPIAPPIPRR